MWFFFSIFFKWSQLGAHYFLVIFISNSLHVSGNYAPIIRRTDCIYATLLFSSCMGGCLVCCSRPDSYLSWAWRSPQVAVTVSLMPDTVDTVIWAPDDGWRYHPKHVEQFADINKLYTVASCWIIIDTSLEENFTSLNWPKNLFMVCQRRNTLGFMNTCCVRFPKSIMDHLHAKESLSCVFSYFLRSLKWPGIETRQIDGEVKTKRSRRKTNTKQYKVWQPGRKCRNMIFVRKCSREYSRSESVSLCSAGNVRKFTSSQVLLRNSCYERKRLEEYTFFYFFPRLCVLASVQSVWQENILFCGILHTSVRVLTLITNLKTHFSEFVTSKPETFMLNCTFFNCRPAGWRLGNLGLIPIRGIDLSCPWFLHRLQVSHGFVSNATGGIYAVAKRSGRDASHYYALRHCTE